jgi:hypothetical protein
MNSCCNWSSVGGVVGGCHISIGILRGAVGSGTFDGAPDDVMLL